MAAIFQLNKFVVVGCGGVGTYLSPMLRYLAATKPGAEVVFIDGDIYERKNLERQDFDREVLNGVANKAMVKVEEFSARFPELNIVACPQYVTRQNVGELIPENSVVFCAVDNHTSRKLISDHISTLNNAVLLSGGNEYTDGNVQVHVRFDGQDATPPITYLHAEIEFPEDKHPGEISCEQKAATTTPQIIFANVQVATQMMTTYWRVEQSLKVASEKGTLDIPYTEAYFDMLTGNIRAINRKRVQDGTNSEREVAISDGRSGRIEAAAGSERESESVLRR